MLLIIKGGMFMIQAKFRNKGEELEGKNHLNGY